MHDNSKTQEKATDEKAGDAHDGDDRENAPEWEGGLQSERCKGGAAVGGVRGRSAFHDRGSKAYDESITSYLGEPGQSVPSNAL